MFQRFFQYISSTRALPWNMNSLLLLSTLQDGAPSLYSSGERWTLLTYSIRYSPPLIVFTRPFTTASKSNP